MLKGHPLKDKMISAIDRFNEYGFLKKWLSDVKLKVQQKQYPKNNIREHHPLKMAQVRYIFQMWGVGMIIATILFALEVLTNISWP